MPKWDKVSHMFEHGGFDTGMAWEELVVEEHQSFGCRRVWFLVLVNWGGPLAVLTEWRRA